MIPFCYKVLRLASSTLLICILSVGMAIMRKLLYRQHHIKPNIGGPFISDIPTKNE